MNTPNPTPPTPDQPTLASQRKNASGGSGTSGGRGWFTLILVCVIMFLLLIGTIVFMGVMFKDRMIAATVNIGLHTVLTQTPLPDEQKKRIVHQTDRLYGAFLANEIELEDLTIVAEHLLQGPVIAVGTVHFIMNNYIDESDLEDAKKADAKLQIGRLTKAVMDEKCKVELIQPMINLAMNPVDPEKPVDPNMAADQLLKEKLTTEEMKEAIALAKKLADDAGVENKLYQFDLAKYVRQAVDELLGQEELSAPPPEPAAPPEVHKNK